MVFDSPDILAQITKPSKQREIQLWNYNTLFMMLGGWEELQWPQAAVSWFIYQQPQIHTSTPALLSSKRFQQRQPPPPLCYFCYTSVWEFQYLKKQLKIYPELMSKESGTPMNTESKLWLQPARVSLGKWPYSFVGKKVDFIAHRWKTKAVIVSPHMFSPTAEINWPKALPTTLWYDNQKISNSLHLLGIIVESPSFTYQYLSLP